MPVLQYNRTAHSDDKNDSFQSELIQWKYKRTNNKSHDNYRRYRQYERYFPCIPPELQKKWLVNLTNVEIPVDVLDIACLGKNFGVPMMTKKEIPIEKIIASIEAKINIINDNDKINEARTQCFNIINNYLRDYNTRIPPSYHGELWRKIRLTYEFKKKHSNILFLKADKGNVTVVVEKHFYITKMLNILNDKSTYRILNHNPTKFIQLYVNKLIRQWYEKSFISERDKFNISSPNCVNACAYGLPKIHKDNTPFRIIVSFVGTPTYHLARYIQEILVLSMKLERKEYSNNKFTIANSISLVKTIRNIQNRLPKNYIMISMDVVSLFTNVPLNLVINGIEKRWDTIKNNTKIPKESFIKAVTLCINSSAFKFNNVMYQQVFGAAMGSPLSPIVADIVMQELENCCLDKLDFPIYFYTRYVDDILVFLPVDKVDVILSVFNSYHKRLQFTVEREYNFRINFLEVTLIRYANRIEIDWYQKSTASGRYLNYYSHHPRSQKIGVVYNLINKAILLGDEHFINKNMAFIRQSLINNGYPAKKIKSIINSRVTLLLLRKVEILDENNNKIMNNYLPTVKITKNIIVLPYVKQLSECLKFALKKFSIVVQFKNCKNNLSPLYNGHKDPLSITDKSCVVYSIPCCECNFLFIHHSKHQLGLVIKKHQQNLRYPHIAHSSTLLTEHAFNYGHYFNFYNVKILAIERDNKKRSLLSNIYTIKFNNTSPKEIANIHEIYHPLITKICE